jgi:hypothetical protein
LEGRISEHRHRQSPGRILSEISGDDPIRLEVRFNEGAAVLPLLEKGGQSMPRIERPWRSDDRLATAILDLLGEPDRRVRGRVLVGRAAAADEHDNHVDIPERAGQISRRHLQDSLVGDELEVSSLRVNASVRWHCRLETPTGRDTNRAVGTWRSVEKATGRAALRRFFLKGTFQFEMHLMV